MTTAINTITITFADVAMHGSVEKALHAYCQERDTISSGAIGSAFTSTEGYTKQHDCETFARRTILDDGGLHYLDVDDGRLASACEASDDDKELGIEHDIEWSDESVVCLECPDIEDAILHPTETAEMARKVIWHHGPRSERAAWARLVRQIVALYSAIEDIDPTELD